MKRRMAWDSAERHLRSRYGQRERGVVPTPDCEVCEAFVDDLPVRDIEEWVRLRERVAATSRKRRSGQPEGQPLNRGDEPRAVSERIDPTSDHITDGRSCWCQPTAELQPDGGYVFVHRELSA